MTASLATQAHQADPVTVTAGDEGHRGLAGQVVPETVCNSS